MNEGEFLGYCIGIPLMFLIYFIGMYFWLRYLANE